ncbi:MAG: TOMM precursor leader peptide-binding protein [Actinobacteria bacterium]|nr:TOMM precursor leader peptide-binding protein [Actinomycetota bacterium]
MMLLAVPERPLLKPWYRLATTEDALLLEHSGTVVRFAGAAARTLLPRLLPLLDGNRTTDELIAIVGRPVAPAVERALELLTEKRLLVEGSADLRSADLEALAEYSSSSVSDLRGRLDTAEVAVIGDYVLTEPLARLLRAAGVGFVTQDSTGSPDLTVVLSNPADPAMLGAWNRRALDDGLVWLAAGDFDGAIATIGPLVIPYETACHECLLLRRGSTSGCAAELAALRSVRPACLIPAPVESLVLAATAHLAIRWIALRDPALAGTVVTVETAASLEVRSHTLLRVPRCPACSPTCTTSSPLPWHEAAPVTS